MSPVRSLAIALVGALLSLPAAAETQVRLALLPIQVNASGSETNYLSRGLAEMISARLEQYQGVSVVRPPAGTEALLPGEEERAFAAARESNARFVLFGSFTQFGEGASLDLRCAEVPAEDADEDERPEVRRVFIQSGTVAEIIPKLDVLAEKVARYTIAEGGAATRVPDVSAPAAGGPAASGAQLEELLQRVDALERAVYKPVAEGDGAAAEDAPDESGATVVR